MPLKELASFSVSHLQVLDEDGNADSEFEPQLEDGQVLAMYRAMVLARRIDERMLNLQRQGRIGTFGPCTGQEACSVGPAFAMGENDWFVGAYRELGARLLRGETMMNPLLYYNGFEEGNVIPGGPGRVLPIAVIVGSQALHAAGIGYAIKYRKETDTAVLTYFGDGGSSQGDVYEGMNFAGLWKAPVVFICQNNQWAISVPRHKQTAAETIAQKAIAAGIHGIQVDGNDLLAMYVATKQAFERAKRGEGPTLIEAMTYRLMMHTTADDPKKYRDPEEEEEAWKRDPIPRFRKYLDKLGIWSDEKQEALEKEIKAQIDKGVEEFEAKTDFPPEAPFDHVYGTRHAVIEEQKAEFLAELKKEQGNG